MLDTVKDAVKQEFAAWLQVPSLSFSLSTRSLCFALFLFLFLYLYFFFARLCPLFHSPCFHFLPLILSLPLFVPHPSFDHTHARSHQSVKTLSKEVGALVMTQQQTALRSEERKRRARAHHVYLQSL
jgi:hypothetical protein